METDFENRNTKQQSIIDDQQKMIDALKDEQIQMKELYEKQYTTLSEQSLQEKNEIKDVSVFIFRLWYCKSTSTFVCFSVCSNSICV